MFDAVIVRTTEGIWIFSPEESFNVFVPKATSCRNVDLEKNISLLVFGSPRPCSYACFLAFFTWHNKIPGISCWSSDINPCFAKSGRLLS